MATALGVTRYRYTHGAGCAPNRMIEIKRRDEQDPKTIFATIFCLREKTTQQISQLAGDHIVVAMMLIEPIMDDNPIMCTEKIMKSVLGGA